MFTQVVPQDGTPDRDAVVDGLVLAMSELISRVTELEKALQAYAEREDLLDVKALAKRWGVSQRTVHNLVAEEQIEPTYIRTSLRFSRDAVEAYENAGRGHHKRRRAPRPQREGRVNEHGYWEWLKAGDRP